jgi:integrase
MAAGQIVISTPKTDESARSIGLDPGTAVALRSFKALQSTERLAAGEAWASPVDWVFTDELGRPLHPTKVSKLFTEAADKAKMRRVRLHDLRHGYATAALEAGAPLKVVSERLGHRNIAITADLYSHVRPEVDQALADQVAGLIMNAETS